MQQALELAKQASLQGEVPVGAVLVDAQENIIASSYNLKETSLRATAHAEMLAIEQACAKLSRWRLTDCTLYVTLEPCFMCAGAIVQARLGKVVFAASDPKAGAVVSLARVLNDPRLNHQCDLEFGVCEAEASLLLKDFFKGRRRLL